MSRALTRQEQKTMIDRCSGRFKLRNQLLIQLGLMTGPRISELLSLKFSDLIDEKTGRVKREVKILQLKKRKASFRTVPINQELVKPIVKLFKKTGSDLSLYVFQSRIGMNRPISRFQAHKIIKSLSIGMEGGISTHSLRKTFATAFYRISRDILETSRILGHSCTKITELYLASNLETVRETVDRMTLGKQKGAA
jgi:integrase